MIYETGIFSSAYAGSIRYYAAMLSCKNIIIHSGEKYNKNAWGWNHCHIIGANGTQNLTLPLIKPSGGSLITSKDLFISEHGDWRRIHWGALFSAYGKSPFFDYIADDLKSIYENQKLTRLMDFNMAIHNLIVDFLDLPIELSVCDEIPTENISDLRRKVGEKHADNLTFIHDIPYWQVWQERYGFTPDMSIIDLLMNHGRESILILNKMLNK